MLIYYGGLPRVRTTEEGLLFVMPGGTPRFSFSFYEIHVERDGPSRRVFARVVAEAEKKEARRQ